MPLDTAIAASARFSAAPCQYVADGQYAALRCFELRCRAAMLRHAADSCFFLLMPPSRRHALLILPPSLDAASMPLFAVLRCDSALSGGKRLTLISVMHTRIRAGG